MKTWRQFDRAINSVQEFAEQNEVLKNAFLYSYAEMTYHLSNALGKSSVKISLESFISGEGVFIDYKAFVNRAQAFIDDLLVNLINDQNSESVYRGLLALDRITMNNPIGLSQEWTAGKEMQAINVLLSGIPIRLDSILNTLEELKKRENKSQNLKLMEKIKSQIIDIRVAP